MENNRYREEELEELAKEGESLESKEEVQDKEESKEENVSKEKSEAQKKNKYKKQIHHLEKKLKEKDEEILEIKNEMLKDRAELENFKKRTQDERMKERKYANQYLVEDLLDMIDIFDAQVNKETDDEKLKKYLMGFKMINSQISEILNRYGLEKIECLHKTFDPQFHEAIETVSVDAEDGEIVEVVRNGYMFKDRVIRPSKVKVNHKENN